MGINNLSAENRRPARRHDKSSWTENFLQHVITIVTIVTVSVSGLKINPKPCSNALGEEGTCMFVWECIKTEGKHLGTCVDGFLFGSCCGHNDTTNNVIDEMVIGDKPPPANHHFPSSSTSTSENLSSSSWFTQVSPSPTSQSPTSSSSSTSSSSIFSSSSSSATSSSTYPNGNPWQPYPPSPSQPPSWATYKPTSPPYVHGSVYNKVTTTTTIKPTERPSTTTYKPITNSNVPSTSRPTAPTTMATTPRPTIAAHPSPDSGNNKPWPPISSPVQGPVSINAPVPPPRPTSPPATNPTTFGTTIHTFRPPIFSIFGTHRPPPGTMFFKPPRPTRPTFRPPVIVNRPTTSIFQPFNPRPSPMPFPQFPAAPTTSATIASSQTTTVATTSEPSSTTTVPTTTVTVSTTQRPNNPVRPNYPQIGNPQSPSSSSQTTLVTRKPPSHHSAKQCGSPPLLPQSKVVGGKNSAFGSWPWQVSVRRTSFFGFSSTHRCGGAIIGNQWIATAGHCVDDLLLSQIRIRVGEYDFASAMEPYPFIERGAKRKVVHPNYNFFTYENDLALVQLDEPIDFQPHISPICLPPDNIELVGRNATVTGWGRLSEGGVLPSVLQEVRVPIVSNDKCKGMFLSAGRHEYIPEIFMCAGYPEGGRDSCQGDSGGPLQVQGDDGKWFLAGIISWGIGCAEPNLPGVCTRISKFKSWILSTVNS